MQRRSMIGLHVEAFANRINRVWVKKFLRKIGTVPEAKGTRPRGARGWDTRKHTVKAGLRPKS